MSNPTTSPAQRRLVALIRTLGDGESLQLSHAFTARYGDRSGCAVRILTLDEDGLLINHTGVNQFAPGELARLATFLEAKHGKAALVAA